MAFWLATVHECLTVTTRKIARLRLRVVQLEIGSASILWSACVLYLTSAHWGWLWWIVRQLAACKFHVRT